MGDLNAFLSQNAIKVENRKYVASNRFINEEGKAIEWEIRALSSEEDAAIRKNCPKREPILNKKGKHTGQYNTVTDYNKYYEELSIACTVFPDLNDSMLQDSYRVMGANQLLKAMLTPGEYAEYVQEVLDINGFDNSFEDKVEEAKN
ncbi:hypothetical protein V3Q09_09410 [Clostridioides difficile]|uniref:phage tail assembly chaperone n=2 Tax=Clostridioides difficile TaxID=1496 RepID=UPI001FAC7C5E|nr:phage portal protein [Clostridioides difficile]MDB0466586.1 phage portal protein [Clostridioides difficile]HDF2648676.1 phage portal protein [Clostridioides difficile]